MHFKYSNHYENLIHFRTIICDTSIGIYHLINLFMHMYPLLKENCPRASPGSTMDPYLCHLHISKYACSRHFKVCPLTVVIAKIIIIYFFVIYGFLNKHYMNFVTWNIISEINLPQANKCSDCCLTHEKHVEHLRNSQLIMLKRKLKEGPPKHAK